MIKCCSNFPISILEDKDHLKGRAMSGFELAALIVMEVLAREEECLNKEQRSLALFK